MQPFYHAKRLVCKEYQTRKITLNIAGVKPEIVKKLQEGVPSLKEAYDMYHKDVFAISYHFLNNLQEAEDIVQDVFIKYSEKKEELTNDNIFSWIKRVTVNKCFDQSRKFNKILRYAQTVFGEDGPSVNSTLPSEYKNELAQALSYIDEKSRMILILKFMYEMDYEEISAMMNSPVGTLKSLVSRALDKINKHHTKGRPYERA